MGGDRVYFNQMLLYFNTVLPLGDFFFFLVTCSLFSGSLGTRIKSKGSVDKGGPFSSSSKKKIPRNEYDTEPGPRPQAQEWGYRFEATEKEKKHPLGFSRWFQK